MADQESHILVYLIDGKSNKPIVRVKHPQKKLNLRSRVEAAVWADRCRRQAKS